MLIGHATVGPLLVDLLQSLLDTGDCEEALLLSIMTAIPKSGKPVDEARYLRPISVTSTWYRLLMRIFTCRLTPFLSSLYSSD